jgi:hypothetical protein
MSSGQVLEAADVLARNDHQPVESGTADHHDVTVDVLRDLKCRPEVGYELRDDTAMAVACQ